MAGTQGLASSEQTRRVTDWRRERRWEMVELKGRQQQETEDQLQWPSHLTWMEQVLAPCWNLIHILIFESSQLEGSYVGDLIVHFCARRLLCLPAFSLFLRPVSLPFQDLHC